MDILCLGDSLTYGYGIPREESWCALASRLTGHRFLNHGVNGATTGEMLERWESGLAAQASASKAEVFVMGGLDDLFMGIGPAVPLANLLAVCEQAIAAGLRPAVGIPMQISPDVDEAWCDGPVDVDYVRSAYAELAETLLAQCRERGIRTIDFRQLIGPAELSFDGIHLNRRGHMRMAEAVAECWGTTRKD